MRRVKNGTVSADQYKRLLNYFLVDDYANGSNRKVFEMRNFNIEFPMGHFNDKADHLIYRQPKVIKVACSFENSLTSGIKANFNEWDVWCKVRDNHDLRKWFCPVIDLSGDAQFLTMLQCGPITRDQLPKEIPDFLKDIHLSNWGMLTWMGETYPVMLDYGLVERHTVVEDYKLVDYEKAINEECGISVTSEE